MSEWISTAAQMPEVRQGTCKSFLVACRRAHNGKTYVFEALYLNDYDLCDVNNDEEERPFTGWHDCKAHSEYDEYYEPIEGASGDVVTHWRPLPAPPEAA